MHDFLLEQGKANEAVATGQILALMVQARALQTDLAEVWKRAERVRGGDALADELTVACDAFRKREKDRWDESHEHYIDRVFPCPPDASYGKYQVFREAVLNHMRETNGRPRSGEECAAMFWAFNTAWGMSAVTTHIACAAWRVALTIRGLPFTYSDDIGQIGEHDVFFGGVELTQDIGEFKAGQRFASASIDFQAGHLTFSTSAGREHRYDFALKVGAKHEGHTCTGCGSVVGQPCRQHA